MYTISFRMDMFRHVGTAIALLRELRGMSQAELARQAGLGKSQVSKYENGKELPKFHSLERILTVLRVPQLGFFYTLHLVEERARKLESEEESTPADMFSVPTLGLSPEVFPAFSKIISDLFDLYTKVFSHALFREHRTDREA